jgi:hypothetical protein
MLDRMHISIEKSGKDSASNIGLTSAVNSIFQPSVFRSSVELKNALEAIVERYVVPQLKYCWGQQSFNIRLDTSYFFDNFDIFYLHQTRYAQQVKINVLTILIFSNKGWEH